MSAIGDSSVWRDQIVASYDLVHAAVMAAWPSCKASIDSTDVVVQTKNASKRAKAARRRREDPITRNLVRHLRLLPTLRGRFHIVSQYELITADLAQDPDPVGYVDMGILFSIGLEEICLFIECKRLNVNGASLAAEYVSKGMMRFVTGKYSPDLPLAAMIGYVMDGQVPKASDSVLAQIRKYLVDLCSAEPLISLIAPGEFITQHTRTSVDIELRHQLLSAV